MAELVVVCVTVIICVFAICTAFGTNTVQKKGKP